MPPAALMSSTAWSTPFLSWAPNDAFGPVSGPPTANLTCACAVPARMRLAPRARPSANRLFMGDPCWLLETPASAADLKFLQRLCITNSGGGALVAESPRLKRQSGQKSPGFCGLFGRCGRTPRPRERAGADVEEAILRRHLARAGHAVPETCEEEGDN